MAKQRSIRKVQQARSGMQAITKTVSHNRRVLVREWLKQTGFERSVEGFNDMYGLANPKRPTAEAVGDVKARMQQFMKILGDELQEGHDVIAAVEGAESKSVAKLKALMPDITQEELVLVMLMDWLGDIQVYAASEMQRFGLPIYPTLRNIMLSNFSKLDEDGKPIIVNGKVEKGPHYFKPEPKLLELLRYMRYSEGVKNAVA